MKLNGTIHVLIAAKIPATDLLDGGGHNAVENALDELRSVGEADVLDAEIRTDHEHINSIYYMREES